MRKHLKPILLLILGAVFLTNLSQLITRVDLGDSKDIIENGKYIKTVFIDKPDKYFLSYEFVKIETCDVLCGNYKGFPLAMWNPDDHYSIDIIGVAINFLFYLIVVAISYLGWKRYKSKFKK